MKIRNISLFFLIFFSATVISILIHEIGHFIFRSLIALLKRDGGEREDAANLFGLNYWMFILVFLTVTVIVMYIWIKWDSIRINFTNVFRFIGLLIAFVVIVVMLETVDQKLFWSKFPKIEIDDGRVYHDPQRYLR